MRMCFIKYFILSYVLLSFFNSYSATIEDIYSRCGEIEVNCSDIVRYTSSAINKIENQTFTYNQYVNGSNVTTTVRVKEIGGFGHTVTELQRIYSEAVEISNRAGMIRQLATQLTAGGGSYDDTDLMAELEEMEQNLHEINISVDSIDSHFYEYMQEFFEPLTDSVSIGFGSLTNQIISLSSFVTNRFAYSAGSNRNGMNGFPFYWYNFSSGKLLLNSSLKWSTYNPYLDDNNSIVYNRFKSLSDLFGFLHFDLNYGFNGIGNTLYTNTLDTISFHRDYQKNFKSYSDFTTNKISEINSIFYNNSPLEDLQADINPSNIYNFVTNYYIKVSTDPSGSASENKTNWFNRIEMLLTALVFRPSETAPSNNFDNATETQSQAFGDSLKSVLEGDISEIQDSSQNVLQDFEKTKTSLLNFFGHLDDKLSSLASIPSHIEFFEITTTSGDNKKVEIVTQGVFASYADALRSITTLCWISFFVYVIFVLSRWLFVKFSAILKFCYSVFKTLIGLG